MARYLAAMLCMIAISAAPTTQPDRINYSSPAKIIEAIPAKLLPVASKSWDSVSDERMNAWLKENVDGKIIADQVIHPQIRMAHSGDEKNPDVSKWFRADYSYKTLVRNREFVIFIEAYLPKDQDHAVAGIRDRDRVRIIGQIESAKVEAQGNYSNLSIVIMLAKISRQ